MNRIWMVAFIVVVLAPALRSQSTDFEEWQRKQNQSFNDFEAGTQADFEKYKADIETKWQKFKESTVSEWVTYGKDLDTRSTVDFENGTVEVVVLVPKTETDVKQVVKKKIATRVKEIVSKDNPSQTSVLKEMLVDTDNKEVTVANADAYSRTAVESGMEIGKSIIGKDGVERIQVRVHMKMVPNYLMKRAEEYLPLIRENCARHDLDIAMVLALMQTESFFNPLAKSSAPAYGLMQLVPRSGGLEANRYIHGIDRKPKPSELYKPANNIQLGTGLLAKMRQKEFAKVKNTQSALYCIISAYNTGPGNVARAITGNRKLGPAIREINKMTPDQLYQRLIGHLPYEETRDYLKKVANRASNYISLR